jgi:malonyl-CoA O-methyltransferase
MTLPAAAPAFDRRAASYDAHAHVQRETAAWVAEWLPPAGACARCLEFGAGTGNFTRHLVERFAEVVATDLAPAMVAQGRVAVPAATWRVADAWAPEASPPAPEFLASCSVLQWAPDPVAALARWRALLAPGGRALSGIYIAPSLPEFGELQPDSRPFPWRTAGEWRAHFVAAGFTVERLESRTRAYFYPDARALLRQLHGTGTTPSEARLGPGAMKDLIRRYDACFTGPEGARATWTTCRVEARA